MKSTYFIIIGIGLLAFLAFSNLDAPTGLSITDVSAKNLDNVVTEFFEIDSIVFPNGQCGILAESIYEDISTAPLDVSAGFDTEGYERIASLNFVTDRTRRFGTVDLIKGPTILARDDADAFIATSTSAIVNVPKRSRVNFLNLDLYGYTIDGYFWVNKGRFSMPSTECIFVVNEGTAFCECDSHSITNMEIAGITGPKPADSNYEKLYERMGLK
jgi:hypothetical protein